MIDLKRMKESCGHFINNPSDKPHKVYFEKVLELIEELERDKLKPEDGKPKECV
jgi:hypothetical protein